MFWILAGGAAAMIFFAGFLFGSAKECDEGRALLHLVSLKDGPRDAYYFANKDEAWRRARTVLYGKDVIRDEHFLKRPRRRFRRSSSD